MQVKDVMTPNVICIDANEPVLKAARLMLQNRISGLPVIDKDGELVGIVTEGDFLRRSELGTQRQRPKWLEFILGPGRPKEYTHSAGRKVEEIMTPDPRTIGEDETLEAVVDTMERHHVKRLPVTRGGRVVGIISRANLMHTLASLSRDAKSSPGSDSTIRDKILAAIGKQDWAPRINVIVNGGVAELHGVITDDRERAGLIVAAENVPGVKRVRDHLVWVEPISGMAFSSSDDEANDRATCEMCDRTLGFRSGIQKAVQLGIGLAVVANTVAIFVALTPLPAKGEEVLSPAAQRGLVIVRTNCSRCHAVGKVGDSPLPIAPPFRTLHERYPVEDLQEPLAEGIVTGHPTMPEFRFDPGQVGDIIAYLKSLER
jgi:CBS domain-containing protein/mono/diheme cytochrome c family protein